jgi:hypothetical protein
MKRGKDRSGQCSPLYPNKLFYLSLAKIAPSRHIRIPIYLSAIGIGTHQNGKPSQRNKSWLLT